MKRIICFISCLITGQLFAQESSLLLKQLQPVSVNLQAVTYKGKDAIRMTGLKKTRYTHELAILQNSSFTNGTIEVELSGDRLPDTDTSNRGFVGIAFRVEGSSDSLRRFDCFYLRPANGRAEDQLRRNHSTQYVSEPEYTWQRLRKENPGVYESYVDLVPGEWTKVKIVVKDRYARLYVNDASEPCLIVTDLKKSVSTGAVALWIGVGTEAYFRNLRITNE
ncbi:MAG: hypothetical protein HYU70_15230 [Bacteroidetes bacterium]|nr:hypothetical protein [Bacteroidota bacterium]